MSMNYDITPQRQAYIDARGILYSRHVLVVARQQVLSKNF